MGHMEGQLRNATIWRYMDVPKFLSMLTTRSLWFSRADSFEDKWEGLSQHSPYRSKRPATPAATYWEQTIEKNKRWRKSLCKLVFINSWTLDAESIPMWKIYGSFDKGIAIQSSTERFRKHVDLTKFPWKALQKCWIPRQAARSRFRLFKEHRFLLAQGMRVTSSQTWLLPLLK
jgi:hypothetical protein